MRSSAVACAGVGPRPDSHGSSAHVATHSASRSDQEIRTAYAPASGMAERPRRLDEPAGLPHLHAPGARVLQVERAQARVAEDPVAADVPHLREAELTRQPEHLVVAELVRLPARFLEELAVDRHHRPAYVARIVEAMLRTRIRHDVSDRSTEAGDLPCRPGPRTVQSSSRIFMETYTLRRRPEAASEKRFRIDYA